MATLSAISINETEISKSPTIEDSNGLITKNPKFDPFKLGWRTRPRITPEGQVEYIRIPLTSYDILHPEEEDFRVHSDEHRRFCRYLDNVISAQTEDIPGATVLHDTRVEWGIPNLGAHGPDIALFFNVKERKRWGTFDVKAEGATPALVIEVTSPSTRRLDIEDKVDHYELAGVLIFIIVDAYSTRDEPNYALVGYQLIDEKYVKMQSDAEGRVWVEPANIWLGLVDNVPKCYDANNNPIGDYEEIAKAVVQEQKRADEEQKRADAAEQQAAQEAQKRQELEEKLQAMEEEVRRAKNQ